MKTIEPALLDINGLCQYLGVGKNTAYELLNSGEIDGFKLNALWRIPKKNVDEYIERKCKQRKRVMCKIVDKGINN